MITIAGLTNLADRFLTMKHAIEYVHPIIHFLVKTVSSISPLYNELFLPFTTSRCFKSLEIR